MTLVRKIVSGVLAACMVGSMGVLSAFAAPAADGVYTGTVAFLHESKDQPSMCNPMFDKDADVVVTDGQATVSVYCANPVPAFPEQGADGTVKNVKITVGGVQYDIVSDMESKTLREFEESSSLFGLTAGESYPTQKLSFTIPAAGLEELAAGAKTDAFVSVVMNDAVVFRLQLTNLTAVPVPSETAQQSMTVSAEIAAPKAEYTVTIPQDIALGTLSAEEDNVLPYKVTVTAKNMGTGHVTVASAAAGLLTSGDNTLRFANSFGEQTFTEDGILNGSFTVSAADVAAAAAGNYTGTATFDISYFAGN